MSASIGGTQFQSYDFGFGTGGKNREDLLDIIVNIAPWETPLFSAAPKTTARHTTHEWIEDTLANATAWAGGAAEGADFSGNTLLTRSRLSNWTMIFRKDVTVSETQRAVNPAGIKDEYAYQMSIAMKEIGRSIEYRLFATGASATASGAARVMKVLDDFISTNTASGSAMDKTLLDSLIEKCFIAGGIPDRVYCHPNTKSKFAANLGGASTVNYRNIAASDARVVGNIDVYISNFGVINLVPDRFIPTAGATTGYGRFWLIEQPKVRVAFLRPIKHVPLPPNGDSVRGMILGELTLEVMAETAHAKAINVTAG